MTGGLRAQMSELPTRPVGKEAVNPGNVREVILNTSLISANALGPSYSWISLWVSNTSS